MPDCEAISAQIALKLGGLLSFMIKNPHVWDKMPIECAIHLHVRSHSIPLTLSTRSLVLPLKIIFYFHKII